MIVIKNIPDMVYLRQNLKEPVGFVPTMGYLHEGHMSLVRKARIENKTVIVSIYVNPTQFGPNEDLSKYPRNIERDLEMLDKEGADVVFFPEDKDMYPAGYDTWVTVDNLTKPLEGNVRPTHFRGVTTVVTKLFNVVRPTYAYFGQKDAQQALVIKKMAVDFNMNLKVIVCPTIREPDGLAMSSRNVYLSAEQRKAAPVLYKSLQKAQELFESGERKADVILDQMTTLISKEPLGKIDYISISDTETLAPLKTIKKSALVSMAVKFGNTRLIDNVILEGKH
jgi:pantoate--beta-alanine ligase